MICLIRCWWPICGRMPGSVMSTASCSSACLRAAAFISVVRSSNMPSISWRISLARLPITGRSSGASLPIMRIRPVMRPLRPSSSTRAASSLAASSAPATSSLASSSSLTRSSIRLMSSLSSLAHSLAGATDAAWRCENAARFGNKKPPSGMCIAQGRLNSAVPPCLTRRMSGPPCPLCAPYREAHGFPTGASPPLAARPLRLLLGSERLALATAGRLAAHDLPSLAGDAAGKTLSVNALGYRITHFASASPRSVLFVLGTRQVVVQTGRASACGARPARLRIRYGKETR